jgi:hypothetical protein
MEINDYRKIKELNGKEIHGKERKRTEMYRRLFAELWK